jgi:predicted HicB family RNase H-like nuclease
MFVYSLNPPSQLHEAATKRASKQGIYLEQFIISAISDRLAAEEEYFDKPK